MALDLTQDGVEIALVPTGNMPEEADWITASWTRQAPTSKVATQNRLTLEYRYVPISATVGADTDSAYARVLVGPGGDVDLPVEGKSVDVFVRVTDSPERPVVRSGTIAIK